MHFHLHLAQIALEFIADLTFAVAEINLSVFRECLCSSHSYFVFVVVLAFPLPKLVQTITPSPQKIFYQLNGAYSSQKVMFRYVSISSLHSINFHHDYRCFKYI